MSEALQFVAIGILILATGFGFVWVARDSKQRGRSPIVWVLLCLITWPVGFMIWRIVRPEPLARADHEGDGSKREGVTDEPEQA